MYYTGISNKYINLEYVILHTERYSYIIILLSVLKYNTCTFILNTYVVLYYVKDVRYNSKCLI